MSAAQSGATRPAWAGGTATGGPVQRHLGLALVVIATAQLMVVLDATIVNVALPHVQHALGFSGTGLEWVVNAYALTFGGLLLLGGRAGDILGRRRVFIAGIILFSVASLARRVRHHPGVAAGRPGLAGSRRRDHRPDGAVPDHHHVPRRTPAQPGDGRLRRDEHRRRRGRPDRRRPAHHLPVLALGAVRQRPDRRRGRDSSHRGLSPRSRRRPGRFDFPGAITSTLGLAALVYGLTSAATTPNGVSHWGDTKVIASLTAAVVLLVTFVIIEARSPHALMPLRIFRNRNRSAANLIMLCIGTAMFGMFFFLTIFVQTVWGYSALKSGIAFLPMVAIIMVMAGASAQLVPRIGARPLLIAGSAIAAGGMFWLSRITEHSTYTTGLLGPLIVTAAGLGMLFMPVTLIALSKVPDRDAGLAASLPNVGQQVGGSIGLALLGTVAWTVVANTARHSAEAAKAAAATAAKAGHPVHAQHLRSQGSRPGHLPPRARGRVLPRVRGLRRDHGHRPDRGARRHPGHARGPGRGCFRARAAGHR